MPPRFWANADAPATSVISNPAIAAQWRRCSVISVLLSRFSRFVVLRSTAPCWALSSFVEPGVLEAPAVVIAIDHHRVPLEIGLPAGRRLRIENSRTSRILRQLALDFPHGLFALGGVWLARLPIDQLVDLGAAITGVVALGAAREILVELLVRI